MPHYIGLVHLMPIHPSIGSVGYVMDEIFQKAHGKVINYTVHSSFIYYLLWNAKCLSPLKSWDNEKQSAYAILDYYISFPITGDDLNLVRQGSHLSSLYTEMTL